MRYPIDSNIVQEFQDKGYVVLPGFFSRDDVDTLKRATLSVIQKYCNDGSMSIFSGKESEKDIESNRDDYFAESGDKIRGFFEENAVDNHGKLKQSRKIENSLNKIGHALHKFEASFRNLTIADNTKRIAQEVAHIDQPVVIQSMVIFKNPKIGGEVKAHQDATYLYTEPRCRSLLGFWIALDDATVENGCLYFSPGSHKTGDVYHRFKRNTKTGAPYFVLEENHKFPTEIPFEAAPAKSGDLVLIDGLVIHKSEHNKSDKPRLAYTFHVINGKSTYSKENWLQPTEAGTFEEL